MSSLIERRWCALASTCDKDMPSQLILAQGRTEVRYPNHNYDRRRVEKGNLPKRLRHRQFK